jgi:hypothetical protein
MTYYLNLCGWMVNDFFVDMEVKVQFFHVAFIFFTYMTMCSKMKQLKWHLQLRQHG